MSRASEYRNLAAKFRREAASAALPQLRQIDLAAAERWEFLADEVDRADSSAPPRGLEWLP